MRRTRRATVRLFHLGNDGEGAKHQLGEGLATRTHRAASFASDTGQAATLIERLGPRLVYVALQSRNTRQCRRSIFGERNTTGMGCNRVFAHNGLMGPDQSIATGGASCATALHRPPLDQRSNVGDAPRDSTA